MSQDLQTNQQTSEPSSNRIPVEPSSVEDHADQLMDELFSEIDRILDGSNKFSMETAQPEYVSLQPLNIAEMSVPETAVTPDEQPKTQLTKEQDQTSPTAPQVLTRKPNTEPKNPSDPKKARYGLLFEKILLGLSFASLLAFAVLWLVSQKKLNLQFGQQYNPASTTQPQISESDAKFIEYTQRSLQAIDRKAQASKQSTATQQNSNQSQLPANVATLPNGTTKVIEKIYIPVYPQQASTPVIPPAASLSSPQAKTTNRSIKQPLSLPRVAGAPPAVAPPQTNTAPSKSWIPATPAKKFTLVGLVEKGKLPAALIEIKGVTQRIYQGQTIGDSNWTLVAIAEQEAIIKRNGEVKSVYVGQKF
jgi:Tfp pilus assembly protein PilP